jgi:pimeloyl-ACP methyl ester carboxylesterase
VPYEVHHTVEGGIERIEYVPHEQRFATPILLQHGMWHSAQCWMAWQAVLASYGWRSIAHSLPGHGESPVQRPLRWCTLGYYLPFLQQELARQDRPPVVFGHSMGGALLQWHFKQHPHSKDLAAAVLVAPWPAWSMVRSIVRTTLRDPIGTLLVLATLSAAPSVRNPRVAAGMLLTEEATITPEALHAQLGPESVWVLLQYQPLLWRPATHPPAYPLLWLAGTADVIPEDEERASARHYRADYLLIDGAGHNLMMERRQHEMIMAIHQWLVARKIT